MSYGKARLYLPWRGVLWRFVLVSFVVLATWNPSHYTLTAWLLTSPVAPSLRLLVAFALALVWLVLLRFAYHGIGRFGLYLLLSAATIVALVSSQYRLLDGLGGFVLALLALGAVAVALTFGLVKAFWLRAITGQSPVVKTPP